MWVLIAAPPEIVRPSYPLEKRWRAICDREQFRFVLGGELHCWDQRQLTLLSRELYGRTCPPKKVRPSQPLEKRWRAVCDRGQSRFASQGEQRRSTQGLCALPYRGFSICRGRPERVRPSIPSWEGREGQPVDLLMHTYPHMRIALFVGVRVTVPQVCLVEVRQGKVCPQDCKDPSDSGLPYPVGVGDLTPATEHVS